MGLMVIYFNTVKFRQFFSLFKKKSLFFSNMVFPLTWIIFCSLKTRIRREEPRLYCFDDSCLSNQFLIYGILSISLY